MPGILRRVRTLSHVGTLKGVGRVYQQTFVDTYAKVGFAKLYDRKTPLTAADLLNDRVIPFYEEHNIALQRVLTDRGTEYCGTHDRREYELYLAVEDIDPGSRGRFLAESLRMLSPVIGIRWALWTRRSRMASASVGLPMISCHCSTGTRLVTMVETG